MRVIARRTLREFVESRKGHKDYAGLKSTLDAWFAEAQAATWKTMADIKRRYAAAGAVTAERVVFNIKGNDYRLVVAVDFGREIVWIKWVATYRDYDRIEVKEVKHHGRLEPDPQRKRL